MITPRTKGDSCLFSVAAAKGSLLAIAFVGGCAAQQDFAANPSAAPSLVSRVHRPLREFSGSLLASSSSKLLYVASSRTGSVYVFTYPQGKRLTTLSSGGTSARGECVDPGGDVFITSDNGNLTGTITEYAHAGTTPIAQLSDPGSPNGCSIDAKSGNLAVVNFADPSNPYNQNWGDIAVYTNARGSPKMYYGSDDIAFFFSGYDNRGNLFATATVQSANPNEPQLVELASGGTTLQNISLPVTLYLGRYFAPSVFWDGKYIAVSTISNRGAQPLMVYRLNIGSGSGSIESATTLKSKQEHFSGQTWLQATDIVAINGFRQNAASIWKYPKGGEPIKSIRKVGPYSRGSELYGVAVSEESSP